MQIKCSKSLHTLLIQACDITKQWAHDHRTSANMVTIVRQSNTYCVKPMNKQTKIPLTPVSKFGCIKQNQVGFPNSNFNKNLILAFYPSEPFSYVHFTMIHPLGKWPQISHKKLKISISHDGVILVALEHTLLSTQVTLLKLFLTHTVLIVWLVNNNTMYNKFWSHICNFTVKKY